MTFSWKIKFRNFQILKFTTEFKYKIKFTYFDSHLQSTREKFVFYPSLAPQLPTYSERELIYLVKHSEIMGAGIYLRHALTGDDF